MAAMGTILKIDDGSISKSFYDVISYKCSKFHLGYLLHYMEFYGAIDL